MENHRTTHVPHCDGQFENGSTENPPKTRLDILLEFLEKGSKNEGRVELMKETQVATTSEVDSKKKKQKGGDKNKQPDDEEKANVPNGAALHSGKKSEGCIFCKGSHSIHECGRVASMSIEDIKSKIKESRACFICMKRGHGAKKCRSSVKCCCCGKRHYTFMCYQIRGQNSSQETVKPATPIAAKSKSKSNKAVPVPEADEEEDHQWEAANVSSRCRQDILLKTVVVRAVGPKGSIRVRLMSDDGSQSSAVGTTLV
jgi:hypothetical protein